MGLSMSEKKAVTQEICGRYRQAERKDKSAILDEFVKTTGYNRKYAVRVLNRCGKTLSVTMDGKSVNVRVAKPKRPGNRTGRPLYGPEVIECLRKIWAFHWYKCGKDLAVYIRENIGCIEASRDSDFKITPEIKKGLIAISTAQIDRRLKADRDKLRVRGISGSRLGEAALMKQIPVRTHYSDAESATPGYFQTDTVHHCGDTGSGEFCLTLTVTDISSGWTKLRPLRNKAYKWTLEGLKHIHAALPFPLLELHSDNGSEFINHGTLDWWKITDTLQLSRSRPRLKNDNCFAEQKNNAFVRNYVGYCRFDTEGELSALGRVYESLCPLLNFFMPNKKLISKTAFGSKTVKKYDGPKTPYRRLMESPHLTAEVKAKLTAARGLYNPVSLQQNVNRAVSALLAAHRAKVTFSK